MAEKETPLQICTRKIKEFLKENELPLTMENIRRGFIFYASALPKETTIKKIYELLAKK
ncbi:unnamed protein product [marine sediment metagenome]|uniref:Uncharacterized protein n=1 Tax=marine sediment metagenome TaxID=412755 RepID=X1FS27_9ZZZZ